MSVSAASTEKSGQESPAGCGVSDAGAGVVDGVGLGSSTLFFRCTMQPVFS